VAPFGGRGPSAGTRPASLASGRFRSVRVCPVPHNSPSLPEFTTWPTFPFEGDIRVRKLEDAVAEEPPRQGEDPETCTACRTPDSEYVWVADRWRVRALDRPSGLPMVLILESRSHLDLGDLPNLLAAELGVMTVRLERAIRSLDGVARVHVNRLGDGSAHLHLWFLARPYGRLQLRGTFLSLWDDILPPVGETVWRANLGIIGAWLAEFGGRSMVAPPRIEWQTPSGLGDSVGLADSGGPALGDDFEPAALEDADATAAVPEPAANTVALPEPRGDDGATARLLTPDPADPEEAWGRDV
jgi:diadenosine tetraphosphate (Ap4A) HIT family hydrolase